MNQRIMEYAEQARLHAQKIYPEVKDIKGWGQVYHEKFAELIVRECAKFLEENSGYDDCDNAWFPEPEHLLRHFGVEE